MLVVEEVVKKTLPEFVLMDGVRATSLFGDFARLHINPSGKFFLCGLLVDAGLTGRLTLGKDPTKVYRSAARVCRQMAKSAVASGLVKQALVQLPCSVGVAEPLSLFVETYDAEQGPSGRRTSRTPSRSRSTAARAPSPCRWRSADPSAG